MTIRALDITTNGRLAGRLEQSGRADYSFAYRTDQASSAVSLTMPVRTASYQYAGLHPVFAQNLPEGYLRDVVSRAIAKIHGSGELAMLASLGPYQIGRLGYQLPGEQMHSEAGAERLETLLKSKNLDLFTELVEKYALRSGVSGIQPKLLVSVSDKAAIRSGRLIVKAWGEDYPDLALNEYFCMRLAQAAGLQVPRFAVSDNGRLFLMERFDISESGEYFGFEDGCSLLGLQPQEKYDSTYERLARAVRDYVSPEYRRSALKDLFVSVLVSCVVRNGDAHLKNFAVLYDGAGQNVRLAPAYDIVTTTVYLPSDVPALHLAGTKRWWKASLLRRFGRQHCEMTAEEIEQAFDRVCRAASVTLVELDAASARFPATGPAMATIWRQALADL